MPGTGANGLPPAPADPVRATYTRGRTRRRDIARPALSRPTNCASAEPADWPTTHASTTPSLSRARHAWRMDLLTLLPRPSSLLPAIAPLVCGCAGGRAIVRRRWWCGPRLIAVALTTTTQALAVAQSQLRAKDALGAGARVRPPRPGKPCGGGQRCPRRRPDLPATRRRTEGCERGQAAQHHGPDEPTRARTNASPPTALRHRYGSTERLRGNLKMAMMRVFLLVLCWASAGWAFVPACPRTTPGMASGCWACTCAGCL